MNYLADHAIVLPSQPSTSGDGVLRHMRTLVILVGGALGTRGTAATETTISDPEWVPFEYTNSGLALGPPATSQAPAISELRRRSGLTWDQLARLFGVDRRSVHFWMSGKALNATNEDRLNRLLITVRYIDRGGAAATRAAIMAALPDGAVPFDLLASGQFDEVMGRLGQGRGHDRMPAQFLQEARSEVRPPRPDRLVGALQDSVHRDLASARAARTTKTKKRP